MRQEAQGDNCEGDGEGCADGEDEAKGVGRGVGVEEEGEDGDGCQVEEAGDAFADCEDGDVDGNKVKLKGCQALELAVTVAFLHDFPSW